MTKIYISGKISGCPLNEARAKFQAAEDRLREQGYEVINPTKNGLPAAAQWEEHMVEDIANLLKCDAVYLLSDWEDSRGARMEKSIAETAGKEIIFEVPGTSAFQNIKEAIFDGMGVTFAEITGESREQKVVFARIIFSQLCRTQEMATVMRIAEEINRSHTTVIYYLKKYQHDFLYTPSFRECVEAVLRNLKDNNGLQ